MNAWTVKLGIGLAVVTVLGGGGYYIKTLIASNAVLEATLESTAMAFGQYATKAESEIDAWSQSASLLSEKYQQSRDERDEKRKRISQADFTKMAERHPVMLADRINRATERMFGDLERITRSSRHPRTAESPTADADNDAPH